TSAGARSAVGNLAQADGGSGGDGLGLRPLDQLTSTNTAAPWRPPTHSVASPRLLPRRCSSFRSVITSRVPVAPTGCPSAMAPPLTLRRVRLSAPNASLRPSCLLANPSDAKALSPPSTSPSHAPS